MTNLSRRTHVPVLTSAHYVDWVLINVLPPTPTVSKHELRWQPLSSVITSNIKYKCDKKVSCNSSGPFVRFIVNKVMMKIVLFCFVCSCCFGGFFPRFFF